MNVKVEVSKTDLNRVLNNMKKITREISNAKKPLRESAEVVVDQSLRNFETQGYTYGETWKPLKESTRKQRARMGYPANRPILVRSGKLKRGAKVKSVTSNQAIVVNEVDYAPYHQFSGNKMPKRTILSTTDKIEKAIKIIFINWIAKILKK